MSSLFSKKYKKSSLKTKSNNDPWFSLSVSSFDLNQSTSNNSNTNNSATKSKLKKLFLPKTTSIEKNEFPLHKSVSCKNIALLNSNLNNQNHRLSVININIEDSYTNDRYMLRFLYFSILYTKRVLFFYATSNFGV